ncbi:corrinoid protein [Sporomusa sp. KB1]|jgi:trimethylamine corrinoid protein|uniref:corrinoid protein n=1 Tax=Sporomusa sp. KB1 TaxID=943346 RepID=UPI0011AA48DA|nr:corrinoid protein [Sporomusa sp. KB1]TWH46815.1 trimethylamine corrinoid protein [Sporomusa sp. KB1]
MSRRKILEKLRRAVEEMETSLAEKAAKEAVASGLDPVVAINEGLAVGMKTVSDLFDEGEVFVPHLLVAAEAFETGVAILTESMPSEARNQSFQGKVLIHTVQGDIHDIGKNIVKTMLSASGFEVFDLGRDVPVAVVVTKAQEFQVDIIVGAALMTTTMPAQRELITCLQEEGIRQQFKIIFGGAPVSSEWVTRIGADGYAESASAAIEVARVLMAEKRAKG